MNQSNHASIRMQQRGFSNEILDVIQSYGRINKAPGGAIKIFFGKKEGVQAINELKQKIKLIERAIGRSVIMSERNIITMYKSNKA